MLLLCAHPQGAPCRPEPDTWRPREDTVFQDSSRIEAAFRAFFYREVSPEEQGEKPEKGKVGEQAARRAPLRLAPLTQDPPAPSSLPAGLSERARGRCDECGGGGQGN